MTSNFPFEGENDVSVVLQIVEGKLPPVHGDGRVRQVVALANLIVECWNLHPDMRPNAKLCERRVHWMVWKSAILALLALTNSGHVGSCSPVQPWREWVFSISICGTLVFYCIFAH